MSEKNSSTKKAITTKDKTDDKYSILKQLNCPKLSGKGADISYELGTDEKKASIFIRVTHNPTGGLFSKEWLPMPEVMKEIDKLPKDTVNLPRFNGHLNLTKVKVSNGKIQQTSPNMAVFTRV